MAEYYLINAMKVRVDDPTAICAAANAELAAVAERYPDDSELPRFLMGRPDDGGRALKWLAHPLRLRYLFAGIELQAETNSFARADRVADVPFEDDPLEPFWAQLEWQRNPPPPPSSTPTMKQVTVTEDPDFESYTVGLIGHDQALLFMCGLDREIGPEVVITLDVAPGSIDLLREGLRRVLACGPRRSRPKRLEV